MSTHIFIIRSTYSTRVTLLCGRLISQCNTLTKHSNPRIAEIGYQLAVCDLKQLVIFLHLMCIKPRNSNFRHNTAVLFSEKMHVVFYAPCHCTRFFLLKIIAVMMKHLSVYSQSTPVKNRLQLFTWYSIRASHLTYSLILCMKNLQIKKRDLI